MKGLLLKDFNLMKVQKNFYLMIAAVAVGITAFSNELVFPLGFLTFIVSLFALSTISYDEFDNGNAFLFSLPITRTVYVTEKYCLGLILSLGSCVLSTLIVTAVSILKGRAPTWDIIIAAITILLLSLVMQAIMLPFQLKFGGEKGRIALIGALGLIFVIGFIVIKIAGFLNIDLAAGINGLSTLSIGMMITSVIAASVILWLISMKISSAIMNKKEF